MALAIVIGICAGVVGFIPLFLFLRLALRSATTSVMSTALYGLAGFCVSLIVVIVEMILCAAVARDLILPFGLAEIFALIIAAVIYVLYKNVLGRRDTPKEE